MDVGIIVQYDERDREEILRVFSRLRHISVFRVKNDQIALAVDTDDIHVLTEKAREIQSIPGVIGVYPVFSLDSLSL